MLSSAKAHASYFIPITNSSNPPATVDVQNVDALDEPRLGNVLRVKSFGVNGLSKRVARNVQPLRAASELDNHNPSADVVRATLAASLVQHWSREPQYNLPSIVPSDPIGCLFCI